MFLYVGAAHDLADGLLGEMTRQTCSCGYYRQPFTARLPAKFDEIARGGAEDSDHPMLLGLPQSNITTTVAMESSAVDRNGQ